MTSTTTNDDMVHLKDGMNTDSKSNQNKSIHDFLGGSENQDLLDNDIDDDSTFLLSFKQKKIVLDLLTNDNNDSNNKPKPAEDSELWGTFPEKHAVAYDNNCDSHRAIDWSGTNPMSVKSLKNNQQQQQQFEIDNSNIESESLIIS